MKGIIPFRHLVYSSTCRSIRGMNGNKDVWNVSSEISDKTYAPEINNMCLVCQRQELKDKGLNDLCNASMLSCSVSSFFHCFFTVMMHTRSISEVACCFSCKKCEIVHTVFAPQVIFENSDTAWNKITNKVYRAPELPLTFWTDFKQTCSLCTETCDNHIGRTGSTTHCGEATNSKNNPSLWAFLVPSLQVATPTGSRMWRNESELNFQQIELTGAWWGYGGLFMPSA